VHRTLRHSPSRFALFGVLLAAGLAVTACGGGGEDAAAPTTGAEVYAAHCATCHGVDGQGGVGPELAGRMETAYPDVDDQIALVSNGKGRMPAWGGRLTPAQIRRVVDYTRTELGG
jgi:mono/diheme cytochrome c family protein